jgi:hypothetical protein
VLVFEQGQRTAVVKLAVRIDLLAQVLPLEVVGFLEILAAVPLGAVNQVVPKAVRLEVRQMAAQEEIFFHLVLDKARNNSEVDRERKDNKLPVHMDHCTILHHN